MGSKEIIDQYGRIAIEMEAVRPALNPKVNYHLLADAIYWSDEIPSSLDSISENCLRLVLRYRTSLILGSPEVKYFPYWQEAVRQFPKWIGFLPARSVSSDELVRIFQSLKKNAEDATFTDESEEDD